MINRRSFFKRSTATLAVGSILKHPLSSAAAPATSPE